MIAKESKAVERINDDLLGGTWRYSFEVYWPQVFTIESKPGSPENFDTIKCILLFPMARQVPIKR